MGVDQGKDLHVVIGRKHQELGRMIIHAGVYKDWEELDSLMRNFNVTRCVVDALPETRNARSFALHHKGRIYLNYYNEHQKGSYKWDDKELIVSCNRTESLDASHRVIMDSSVVLPRECDVIREFAEHLHNTAKRLEEDEESGSKRYVYVKLGADHFRHAFNYQTMAEDFRVPAMGLWEYMQAEHRELMKRQGRKQEPSIDLLSTHISGSTSMHIAADGTHTSPALMSTRMGGGE